MEEAWDEIFAAKFPDGIPMEDLQVVKQQLADEVMKIAAITTQNRLRKFVVSLSPITQPCVSYVVLKAKIKAISSDIHQLLLHHCTTFHMKNNEFNSVAILPYWHASLRKKKENSPKIVLY